MEEPSKSGFLPFLKKTAIFLGLTLVIVFIGSGVEMGVYEFLLGSSLRSGHIYSKIWGNIVLSVLIPVVYMSGVNGKKRVVVFLKSAFVLVAVYFSYYYLIYSLSAFIKPSLLSIPFRILFFLANLKSVVAMSAGLYVSIKSMRFEREKNSFTSYLFPNESQPTQDLGQEEPADLALVADPDSQRTEANMVELSVENLPETVAPKPPKVPAERPRKIEVKNCLCPFLFFQLFCDSVLDILWFYYEDLCLLPSFGEFFVNPFVPFMV
jgi:hypothetical protein